MKLASIAEREQIQDRKAGLKVKGDCFSLMSEGDCFSLMSVGELIKVKG